MGYEPMTSALPVQRSTSSQLPVDLLAQLVERCTGIAKVMGSNPVRA